jgi:hypothetical protein
MSPFDSQQVLVEVLLMPVVQRKRPTAFEDRNDMNDLKLQYDLRQRSCPSMLVIHGKRSYL